MEDALDRESFEPYPENEIMSDSISSVRGKGILSPIAPGSISLVDPYHSWPEVGHPVEVIVTRPINASKTCSASIMNEKNDFVTGKVIGKKTGTAKPNHYTYKLNYWEGLEECKELTMICVWGNAVDREVSCSIKITR